MRGAAGPSGSLPAAHWPFSAGPGASLPRTLSSSPRFLGQVGLPRPSPLDTAGPVPGHWIWEGAWVGGALVLRPVPSVSHTSGLGGLGACRICVHVWLILGWVSSCGSRPSADRASTGHSAVHTYMCWEMRLAPGEAASHGLYVRQVPCAASSGPSNISPRAAEAANEKMVLLVGLMELLSPDSVWRWRDKESTVPLFPFLRGRLPGISGHSNLRHLSRCWLRKVYQ